MFVYLIFCILVAMLYSYVIYYIVHVHTLYITILGAVHLPTKFFCTLSQNKIDDGNGFLSPTAQIIIPKVTLKIEVISKTNPYNNVAGLTAGINTPTPFT